MKVIMGQKKKLYTLTLRRNSNSLGLVAEIDLNYDEILTLVTEPNRLQLLLKDLLKEIQFNIPNKYKK